MSTSVARTSPPCSSGRRRTTTSGALPTADEVVAEPARQAQVARPESAAVYSLDVLTNSNRFAISTVPRAVRGPAVRKAAVAGSFYEADPAALANTVDRLLAGESRREA